METAPTMKEEIQEKFLKCAICYDKFTNPRFLPCFHVCCTNCIHGVIENKKIKAASFSCPFCKKDTKVPANGAEGFPVAFYINALQDFVHNHGPEKVLIPCYHGSNGTVHHWADVKCMDCNVYYCSTCNTDHKKAAVAEKHTILQISDLKKEHFEKAAQSQVTYCPEHLESPQNFYCKTPRCQIPVCYRCCITNHSQHEVVDLEKISNQCREKMAQILKTEFPFNEEELRKVKEKTNNNIKGVKKEFDENNKAIEKRFDEMQQKLMTETQQLMRDIEFWRDEKLRKLESNLEDIDKKFSTLEATKTVIKNMTSFSPDNAIVQQHKELERTVRQTLQESKIYSAQISTTKVEGLGNPSLDMKLRVKITDPSKNTKAKENYTDLYTDNSVKGTHLDFEPNYEGSSSYRSYALPSKNKAPTS